MSATLVHSANAGGVFRPIGVRAKPARLYPREHGAYAILAVPLATALAVAGLTLETVLIGIAGVTAFLAHEPLLIVSGGRGTRARAATPAAMRLLRVQLAVVATCGGLAFFWGETTVRRGLALCLIFAAISLVISVSGHNRTLPAQICGIGGLTLPSAVVLAAGGVGLNTAIQFWLIWVAGRIATTVSVRSVIARYKASAPKLTIRIGDALLVASGVVVCVGIFSSGALWTLALPMLVAAAVLRFANPHPIAIKRIGWSLLAVNIASGLLMIALWNS